MTYGCRKPHPRHATWGKPMLAVAAIKVAVYLAAPTLYGFGHSPVRRGLRSAITMPAGPWCSVGARMSRHDTARRHDTAPEPAESRTKQYRRTLRALIRSRSSGLNLLARTSR